MRWPAHKIAEVAQVNPKLATADRPDPSQKVSFVPMAAVSGETTSIGVHAERRFSEVAKGYTPFRRGDILVAKITPCFENGKMALVEDIPHEMGFGTTEFHVFRPTERITGSYLFHLLRVPGVRKAGAMKMRGAAGQRRVPADFLALLPIPVPPLPEQKRIAGILDEADALRAKRREALAQLDTLLQSTFLDMFGDPVTNPMGWAVERIDSWLDGIDSGWSPKCLNRKALIHEWGVLKLGAVTWCEFDDSEQKALPADLAPRPELEVAPGDLLFVRKNTHDLVAAVAYVHNVRPRLMLSDLVFRLRLKAGVRPIFLWQLLMQPRQRRVVQRFAGGSAGSMPNISKAKLKTLELIKPSLQLQERFAAVAESVERQKAGQRAHLAELDTLFASLQSRAFRGEL